MSSFSTSNFARSSAGTVEEQIRAEDEGPRAVVFIDGAVRHPELLLGGLPKGITARLVNDAEDGLAVIGDWLKDHAPVSSIHVLAHGWPGAFRLGRTVVSPETVASRALEVRGWAAWLDEEPELLLYACRLAKGDGGQALCELMHGLTGARVAASTTPTGNPDMGGDWDLDWAPLPMRSPLAVSSAARAAYPGVLEDPVYSESQVHTYTPGNQFQPVVTVLPDGSYVVVWTSYGQDGLYSHGIYAQRFSASGVPIGPEVRVNTTIANDQSDPSIAALSTGGYVVTWTDNVKDGSGTGIFAQRFDANGVAQGSEFQVNATSTYAQSQSSVASSSGGFVVAWASDGIDGSSYGIYAQRYDASGVPQGTEFRVNTYTSGYQGEPAVASRADGSFVVVWRSDYQDGDSQGVYAQRYDASGVAQGTEFRVNSFTTWGQYEPKVAMLAGGGFVVVWRSDNQDGNGAGVYAQRYDASGVPQGTELRVNETTIGNQYQPDVTALANGGFAVTWYNDYYADVYVREFAADGTPVGGEVRANTPATGSTYQYEPAIAHLGSDNYVVVWRSDGQDGSEGGIYQQLFGTAVELPRQASPELGDFTGTVTFGENLVNAAPQVIDHVISLTDVDSANFAGGRIELFFVQYGGAEDQLGLRNQGTGVGQIGVAGSTVTFNDGTGAVSIGSLSGGANGTSLIVNFNANATVDAVEALIQNFTYANTSQSPSLSRTVALRVYDGDGGTSNAGVVTIDVTPEADGVPAAYGEEPVNTFTASQQQWPAIARLTDGGYVVAWQSYAQDGSEWGIYIQRFAANGAAIGPELRVNSTTASEQSWPQIAGLSNGGYVVTWQDSGSADGNGWGVFGRIYNASGVAEGSQFLINTTTSGTQFHDNVAAYAGGGSVAAGFAAVWSTDNDIYLQRFDNIGVKQGVEVLVSTAPGSGSAQNGAQYLPDVAAYANGNLVIVWSDAGENDGNGNGVYARLYNAATNTLGDTFRVNSTTSGNQGNSNNGEYAPNVAVLSNGDFVVVWPSDNNDGSGWAVMGQRFNASGAKLGGEFLVNETTAGNQHTPDIAALSTGGFVVTWYNDNYDLSGTGTTADVYVREYDASGNAIDGQRKLASASNFIESQPAVASLGNGNFVVAYADVATSASGGNDTWEIVQQVFGETAELPRSTSPQLEDIANTVTFAESSVNAGLQVIDAAVGLSDPDSGNFNGGRLYLYYVQNAAVEDQLGVLHQGNGAGQIGVSGNTVSYGGVSIGTISGGANGANLRIDFTSESATVDAVEALIQRLGYGNTDSSPNAARVLGLRVSDGDGGSNEPSLITINVTPELDGTPKAYGEAPVNTYTAGEQSEPEVARLADGGYVAVWQSNGQDGSSYGVYAQRFTAAGVAIGPEWRVNSTTGGQQSYPHVAGLSDGGYVITWQDDSGLDGSGWGVFGQMYEASGVARGGQFRINNTTSGYQYHDAVAAYGGGGGVAAGFAVLWASENITGGSGMDIVLQRYDNAGAKVGGELLVNTTVAGTQQLPDVAAYANGNLVIVWQDESGNDGHGYGVYGRTYNASAGTFGTAFRVNTLTAGNQYEPRVATLSDGGFVMVWGDSSGVDGSGWATFARVYDASGNALADAFRINEYASGSQYQPTVTGLSTGGFVVSFYNDSDPDGQGAADVWIREYDNAGNPVDGDRRVNAFVTHAQYQPAVVDLGDGNYVVMWRSDNQDGSSAGIYQQVFGSTAELPRSASPQLEGFASAVTFAEDTVNAGLQVIDVVVGLSDPDSGNFNGGRLNLYYVQNGHAEDQLGVVHEGSGAGQIGVSGNTVSYGGIQIGTISGGTNGANLRIDFTSDAATVGAVEALIQRLGYANTDSSPNQVRVLGLRVSDGDGGSSEPAMITINVTAELDGTPHAYGESQVNSFTPSTQTAPAVAPLSSGGYVVTWVSTSQDGTIGGEGVFAQRFTAAGVAIGPEFRLNATISGDQTQPAAAGLSDGGFVVVWTTPDGNGTGVHAQRYDVSGSKVGVETLVNTTTASTQQEASVAAYTGGYVVAWSSYNQDAASTYGIYAQRFNNDGSSNGVEFRVNASVANNQTTPDVAAFVDGSFVVTWSDNAKDGSGTGIYAQRFDSIGATVGSEFKVNTLTAGNQVEPRVATLSDGGFVVVWTDQSNADGASYGVYAQRYDSAGNAQGGQFLVNETTAGNQYQPDVAPLEGGGFVVSWYNDNYDLSGTGTTQDVYIREFDASGNPVDGQRKLASDSNSVESQPVIAHLGNGNYVVAYSDYATSATGGNDTYDIAQRLFGNTAELPRQANPLLDDLRDVRNLSFNTGTYFAGTPQVIDSDVWVADSDSTDFDGGSLIVQFLDTLGGGSRPNESLAIRNQGTGTGQIGVSGSNVTYGGVTIGTFTGGTAGTDLLVSLNASADPAAVRALVQNITYVHASPGTSQTDRYIGFRLFDGDGGASAAQDMLVRIQATVTPATVFLDDVESSVILTETQAQAGAVLDPGVHLSYNGSTGFSGGSLTVSYVAGTGRPEDQLSIRDEGTGTGQVGVSGANVTYQGATIGTINAADTGANGDQLVISFNANATDQAIERVIENLRYQTTSDGQNPTRTIQIVVRDGANVASTTIEMVINVAPELDGASPLFGERQVNTYEPGDQTVPVVTGLQGVNDGSYVVLWRSNGQDGSSYGIYGQRYDAKGAAVGAEFQVNSFTLYGQYEPEVAGLADGGFVAVWRSDNQDGNGTGVYAQIFGPNGAPVGGEILVNTTTIGNQYEPAVVGLADGSFVVAYRSEYTVSAWNGGDNVLAKRFDASGDLLTAEFTLNTTTSGTQYSPRLAALADGKFVALWADDSGNDGSGYGVFSKVFNPDGTQAASEQVASTTVSGNQYGQDVAALAGGGYVAV